MMTKIYDGGYNDLTNDCLCFSYALEILTCYVPSLKLVEPSIREFQPQPESWAMTQVFNILKCYVPSLKLVEVSIREFQPRPEGWVMT